MRATPITPGEHYHLYNRGTRKEKIFFTPKHWRFFLRRVKEYFLPEYGDVIAYCLMPNHFHLIAQVYCEDFGLKVMMPLSVSYTKAVNRETGRTGHLFQGPYQARHIASTAQLIQLSRYIHLNPVKAGFVTKPEDWKFSSYREYVGLRNGEIPNPTIVMSEFLNFDDYRAYVETVQVNEKMDDLFFDES